MAAEAFAPHIAGMREDGEELPEPSTFDSLGNDPAMRDAAAFLVQRPESERAVRFNIIARESQLAEIDIRARAAKLRRSAFLDDGASEKGKSGVIEIAPTRPNTRARAKPG